MTPQWNDSNAFRGLDAFSHIWLLFGFHLCADSDAVKPLVRPPRLGGNDKVGVFASRSPFRPNHIGQSVVAYRGLKHTKQQLLVQISGIDCVDNTPVYDIKPYVPYADSIPNAQGGFAPQAPEMLAVDLATVSQQLAALPQKVIAQVSHILACDPRPAYQDDPQRVYKVHLFDWHWHFVVADNTLKVIDIVRN
jgi:tRNA-Thr(GGU) m(6)t(6)A37 methyltransferase TsaA